MKTTFDDQARRDIKVQRFDVQLALGLLCGDREFAQRVSLVDPPASFGSVRAA